MKWALYPFTIPPFPFSLYPSPMLDPTPYPGKPPDGARSWRPRRAKMWHDALIDILLVEPTLTQKEAAARLGRSEVAVSYVMGSDLWKARYEARRVLINETLAHAISSKLTRLAVDAIEITHEKLKLQRDKLPFEDLVDVTDKTLARLGYGAKQNNSSVVINNNAQQVVAPISADELEAIRSKLRAEQQRTIEGTALGGGAPAVQAIAELAVEVKGEGTDILADIVPPEDDSPELEQL